MSANVPKDLDLISDVVLRYRPPEKVAESFRINAEHAARLDALIVPAGVTDHSSYELGITMERERCAGIAEAEQITYAVEKYHEMNGYNACRQIAAAIRSGK